MRVVATAAPVETIADPISVTRVAIRRVSAPRIDAQAFRVLIQAQVQANLDGADLARQISRAQFEAQAEFDRAMARAQRQIERSRVLRGVPEPPISF